MPSATFFFTQQSDDETSFEVQRKEQGGTFAFLTTVSADATPAPSPITFQDLSVLNGITYIYRVRAKNGALSSAWSNEATITISGDPPPPVIIPDDTDLGGIRAQMPRVYGMDGVFGRGAGGTPAIIRVNTLTWDTALSAVGDGTLQGGMKAAHEYNGPAYVIVEESGDMIATTPSFGAFPYKYIAGQTAPSPGLNIRAGNFVGTGGAGVFECNTHDVIYSHFRVRGGSGGHSNIGCWDERPYGGSGSRPLNVVFDHISASWGADENFYCLGDAITYWRCLCGESLYGETIGSQGVSAGHGVLFGPGVQGGAAIGCLIHSCGRGPELHEDSAIFIADVLNSNGCGPVDLHNPAASLWYQTEPPFPTIASYINFRAKQGPSTPDGYDAINVYYSFDGNRIYLRDCTSTGTYNPFSYGIAGGGGTDPRVGTSPVLIPGGWISVGSSVLEAWLNANVGARPNDRDSVDDRYLTEALAGTGDWVQTVAEAGGYPSIAHNHATFTVPANPFGDLDSFGRNNLDRALDAAAIALET